MNLSAAMANAFVTKHTEEAADIIHKLNSSSATELMDALDPEVAAGLLKHINPLLSATILAELRVARSVAILQAARHDVIVRALRPVDIDRREEILSNLPQDLSRTILRLLEYPPESAGSLADSQVLTLSARESVGNAIERLRREARRSAYYLYVLGENGRLCGVLTMRELFLAGDLETPVVSIAHPDPIFLPIEADIKAMLRHRAWHSFNALPVVDRSGNFVGMVRHETVRSLVQNFEHRPELEQTSAALAEVFSIGFLSAFNWASGIGKHNLSRKERKP